VDIEPLIDKWIGYGEGAVIAVIGQLGMQAYYWASDKPTGCTVRRVIGWIVVAGVLGMMVKAAAPDWFPGTDPLLFAVGMFAMVLFARLRVTMPAWIIRVVRGAGNPLDD
jgi:hypothetical protein